MVMKQSSPFLWLMASSFDEAIIKEAARLSAHEGTNEGVMLHFRQMQIM